MSWPDCPGGAEFSAPVDLFYPDPGILIRRVPGLADAANRTCRPKVFDRGAELDELKATLALEELPELTILKARRADGASALIREKRCEAKLDVGLGSDANFVLLDIAAEWRARGPEAHIEEAAMHLRTRLEQFAWN